MTALGEAVKVSWLIAPRSRRPVPEIFWLDFLNPKQLKMLLVQRDEAETKMLAFPVAFRPQTTLRLKLSL
ncbi:hypothetical protein C7B82_07860 [Stenomitos frigidus ULC18]|uniref:Uncharacterized protein n=1 Tax=Stenomitos frigidus ULC18 TaxID=2107698 RepID=A0A2T1EE65_9CYAN|nr:hypothetical protein C7B82_07860 [Stenomitos frigidus ULC18]